MLFIYKNFNFDISLFLLFPTQIRSRLANFKIENLRIQRTSLCGTTLDLHYNTRILASDKVFGAVVGDYQLDIEIFCLRTWLSIFLIILIFLWFIWLCLIFVLFCVNFCFWMFYLIFLWNFLIYAKEPSIRVWSRNRENFS